METNMQNLDNQEKATENQVGQESETKEAKPSNEVKFETVPASSYSHLKPWGTPDPNRPEKLKKGAKAPATHQQVMAALSEKGYTAQKHANLYKTQAATKTARRCAFTTAGQIANAMKGAEVQTNGKGGLALAYRVVVNQ